MQTQYTIIAFIVMMISVIAIGYYFNGHATKEQMETYKYSEEKAQIERRMSEMSY